MHPYKKLTAKQRCSRSIPTRTWLITKLLLNYYLRLLQISQFVILNRVKDDRIRENRLLQETNLFLKSKNPANEVQQDLCTQFPTGNSATETNGVQLENENFLSMKGNHGTARRGTSAHSLECPQINIPQWKQTVPGLNAINNGYSSRLCLRRYGNQSKSVKKILFRYFK